MPKLAKNMYTTSKGERKLNCYVCAIPKELVKKAGIEDDDEIVVYEQLDTIVIAKKYHYICMECDYEWDSGKECHTCPLCKVGDICCDIKEESNDYQKQRVEKNA